MEYSIKPGDGLSADRRNETDSFSDNDGVSKYHNPPTFKAMHLNPLHALY